MRPTIAHRIQELASECTDPDRAELKMRGTMEQALLKNESTLRTNLLKKLYGRKIGNHAVERMAMT